MPRTPPDVELYQLGRGILSIGEWSGDTPPASYTDVGNCPRMEIEVTEEKLDHFSSRSGTRLKDKTATLEVGYALNFDLDEVALSNLAKYLRGTVVGNVIRAATALAKEYAVKFVSDNPEGEQQTWEFWKVRLTPGGSFSLIGDEWSLLTFTGEGLADTANHANTPYFDVTVHTTTTSA